MTEEINVDLTEEEATNFPEPKLNPQEQASRERALEMGKTADEVSGFKVPTDFVSIPSSGKVYPPDSPLHKVTELEVKFLTAQDEDILTSRSLLRSGKAIDAVLSNCLSQLAVPCFRSCALSILSSSVIHLSGSLQRTA